MPIVVVLVVVPLQMGKDLESLNDLLSYNYDSRFWGKDNGVFN